MIISLSARAKHSRSSKTRWYSSYSSSLIFHPSLNQRSVPALFVRGGTSNGLIFRADDLPSLPSSEDYKEILTRAMGSPDPEHGRQLDGMGSGISSTSKVVVLKKSEKEGVDVEYTFWQVGIREGVLDGAGNCGNLSSIVGPVAWDWGMVKEPMLQSSPSESDQESPSPSKAIATVTILNTNTNKLIKSSFDVKAITSRFSSTVVNDHTKSCDLLDQYKYCPRGAYYISGVSNPGSAIKLSFLNPGGAKTGHILPTGNPIDELEVITPANTSVDDITATKTITVRASLIDVSNPGVFVRADDLFVENFCEMTPEKLAQDEATMRLLEGIRQEGAQRMGMDPAIESVPKVVILFPPGAKTHDTDEIVQDEEEDIRCLALSMGQPHRAVPLTLALCLGAAARMEGTIADELVRMGGGLKDPAGEKVRIAHPSGTVDVGISRLGNGRIRAAELYRTARVMMQGNVFY